jgi:hypothetical protein
MKRLLLILALALPLVAQTERTPAEKPERIPVIHEVVPDSLPEDTIPPEHADTLTAEPDTAQAAPVKPQKSVAAAMLLSTFIPGGGQFYNESHWKGGIVAAAEITLASFTIREQLLISTLDEAFSGAALDSVRTVHRNRRNVYAFFTGAVIAFAVSDAYVDAHMFGFRESQRLSLEPSERGVGLALLYRF